MKKTILGIIIALILLSAYPVWRYFNNAKVFAQALVSNFSSVGIWNLGEIKTTLTGKITISNVSLKPSNYNQKLNISSLTIKTDPLFLFENNARTLETLLPDTLTIAINTISFDTNDDDFYQMLRLNGLWMITAGYSGSFGCKDDSFTTFEPADWANIIGPEQVFNIDLFYLRAEDGSIDTDLLINAEELFSSTWSSNLKSSYGENTINVADLVTKKLYYNYIDDGFNLKRNNACRKNYQSSFSKYRLNSAHHLQNYIRAHYTKELSSKIIGIYQRLLIPQVEFNAIINLDESTYISEIASSKQTDLYKKASVEISTGADEYIPVNLVDIDYTKININELNLDKIKVKKEEKLVKQKEIIKVKQKSQPKVFTSGSRKSRKISIANLNKYINKRIRVKTKKGRPIVGYLNGYSGGMLSIDTFYTSGTATLTLPRNNILSVELIP